MSTGKPPLGIAASIVCFAALVACSPSGSGNLTETREAAQASRIATLESTVATRDRQIAELEAAIGAAQHKADQKQAAVSSTNDEEPVHEQARVRRAQYPGNCYKDYCPCDPPQYGVDGQLCDQLEEGIDVDVNLMIAGRGFREARREARDLGQPMD